ncbi:MAG: Gfo/Idh/MocA family oxidoreductase [Chloroflexota bacterium]|nr:Gfo/Idh/MocA family oxidoreductase [Chloroflexota bacterium]
MSADGIRLVVVGLRFGASFVPIYQRHPDVADVAVCDLDAALLARIGDRHAVARQFGSLDEVLAADEWDAVHLATPVPLHVEQAVAALRAGKHTACAVPAGTTIEGLRALVAAQRETGRTYMMMETAVYTREFLYVKDLYDRGQLGAIQLLRGAHYQDMEGWPSYWAGLPPMHYATHALGPLLHLAGARATEVRCYGSGRMRPALQAPYGNPFPIETATFRLAGPGVDGVAAEVTRSLFETAVAFKESFDVYGDRATFLWQQVPGDAPALISFDPGIAAEPAGAATDPQGTQGSPRRQVVVERPEVPYRPDLLPAALGEFAQGGHGGSHPHLVHEFVRSIVVGRPPAVDAARAAHWTAAGLCAHESALRGGAAVAIPSFD